MPAPRLRAVALASTLAVAVPAAAEDQAIIVLDASGSMWGQVDGRPKLEIARETLATVLRDVPDDVALGLMAYGHRSKGACDDIELVVPPRAGSAGDIAAAAATMKFLGMTPLTEAVARAARELRHTERKATVVLVTDGLETCKADPCAMATALEEAGVDFTAHVVGFGLSDEEGRQVACLAENTGGRYFAAGDAASLASALTEAVVEAPPAPPLPEASLQAPAQVPMSSRLTVQWTGPGARYDDVQLFDPAARGGNGVIVDSQRVRDAATFDGRTVELVAPGTPGRYQLRYFDGESRRVAATRDLEVVEAAVALEAPEEVAIASQLTVGWTGPGEQFDDIQVFDPAARGGSGAIVDSQRVRSDRLAAERKVTLVAPATPGEYQLRYWNGHNRQVLATRSLRVVAADVGLAAPEAVPAASTFTVDWTGPGARFDEVQVFDPAARGGDGAIVDGQRVQTDKGFGERQVSLVAPARPGTYLLRYYNGDNRQVLLTRPLQVTAIAVALDAPERAPAGSPLVVGWTGPGARYDDVQVFDPAARGGSGQVLSSRRLASDKGFADRTATIALPKAPGRYELRYWNGDNREVLATRPLLVE